MGVASSSVELFGSPLPRRKALHMRILGSSAMGVARAMIPAVLLVLAAGCASVMDQYAYPVEWASVKTSPTEDGCPKLAGAYSNRSIAAAPDAAGALKLSDLLTSMAQGHTPTSPSSSSPWPIIPNDPQSVSIDQTRETTTVTFLSADSASTSLAFRRSPMIELGRFDDLFHCQSLSTGPLLTFLAELRSSGSGSAVNTFLPIQGSDVLVSMLKAADGSLIVQVRGITGRKFLVLTISVNSVWYRFPPLDASKPVQH